MTELTVFIIARPVHNNLLSPGLFSQKCCRLFDLHQGLFLVFLREKKLSSCGMTLILCKLPFQNMKHLLSDYFNVNETLLGSLQEKCTLQVTGIFSQNAFIIYAHLSNATVQYVINNRGAYLPFICTENF